MKHGHAAKFRAPDDEGVLEQTALLEVAHEGGSGLVEDGRMLVVLFFQLVMAVPVEFAAAGVGSIEELHESHSVFDQSPGEDAVPGKSDLDRIRGVICTVTF